MAGTQTNATRSTLVLDIGKTNVKLMVMSKIGSILDESRMDNASIDAPPYLHLDPDRIWQWLLDRAAEFAQGYDIDAIITTTHGCAGVLVDDAGPILPPMDYEANVPDDVAKAFEVVQPPFSQSQCPSLPQGQNLGRQLFWQQHAFPDQFAQTQWVLTYPQYWAWRLSGVAASEITSMGCHSHLWEPGNRRFSTLVEQMGWRELFPPMKAAFDALGTIMPHIAQRTGLSPDCRVYNGIHDSNSAYSLYLHGHERAFSLVSTGTWVIMFSPRMDLAQLNQDRDTLATVNLLGEPLPTARFMGGREFEILTGDLDTREFSVRDVRAVIDKRSFLSPSFTLGGPFSGRQGKTVGPELTEPGEILARATIYLALVTRTSMNILQSDGDLLIDGGFVNNTMYCRLLAKLSGHERCYVNHATEGTAVGAGMLTVWNDDSSAAPLELTPVEPFEDPGLDAYAAQWERLAQAPA